MPLKGLCRMFISIKLMYIPNFDGIRYLNSYSLTEIISEKSQVNLSDGDIVILYDKSKIEGERSVSISGFGTQPSTIEWKENFSLYDIIFD